MDQHDRGSGDPHAAGRPVPTSPTGRVPQWVLDEAAGRPVEPIPWRSPGHPSVPRRRPGRSLLHAVLVVPLVLLLSLGAARMPEILALPGGAETARGIVLHELGHLVGLAHVEDGEQLMYPQARREVSDFAPGDLTGLAVLGAGPCVPEL